MSANDEKVKLKIRLTEEEKAKLEHGAALCGLTMDMVYTNEERHRHMAQEQRKGTRYR